MILLLLFILFEYDVFVYPHGSSTYVGHLEIIKIRLYVQFQEIIIFSLKIVIRNIFEFEFYFHNSRELAPCGEIQILGVMTTTHLYGHSYSLFHHPYDANEIIKVLSKKILRKSVVYPKGQGNSDVLQIVTF